MDNEFTVQLVAYDPRWAVESLVEAKSIARALGIPADRIHHVGSTAVPGLAAKPIIDLFAADDCLHGAGYYTGRLAPLGYQWEAVADSDRFLFWRGRPRRYHLHIAAHNSWHHWRLILFRDYLTTHPAEAQNYLQVKTDLARRYRTDRKAYSQAKGEYVNHVLALALADRPELRDRFCRQSP
jgi:GrpB-like predicted nucleotidyltransferase (UPF0157 family)